MYKFLVIAAVLAYANAGLIGAPAYATTYAAAPVAYAAPAVSTAIGTSQQSTLRSLDGGNVVSQYSKAVDTAFSSVRKYDTRITNDARLLAPAVATYAHAAPAVATYAAPAVATYAHAAPVVAAKAYAPAVTTYAHAAPAVATYAAPAVATYAHAAPVVAAKAYAPAVAAAPVAHAGLLGVAYSAAPAVAHIAFDGLGAHYAW